MDDEERTRRTIAHYDASAQSFRDGTWGHDVSQNRAALLDAIEGPPPYTLLDLGCGPGRDLAYFTSQGHTAVGVDGSAQLVELARATGCEVLRQDFLDLDLGRGRFHGVFANASLFHVPSAHLPRVLGQIHDALVPRGVLFSSNPHGDDVEGWSRDRYGCFWTLETWSRFLTDAGFVALGHYYRPPGRPRAEQPWLATTWRRADGGA